MVDDSAEKNSQVEDEAESSDPVAESPFLRDKQADEDWKKRVEDEKRKLDETEAPRPPELPPATFLGFLQELSLRAMIALGQIPSPVDNQQRVDLQSARYTIDLLGILEEKTRGNLTPDESKFLAELAQNLRLAFVHVTKNPPKPGKVGDAEADSKITI